VAGSSQLWDAFASRTADLGDRAAVEAEGVELGFAEVWQEAERLATFFREAGVREGGVTGLALGNSQLFPAAFLALCRLDATVALLPPQYGRSELIAIADGVGLSGIVSDTASGPRIAAAIPVARSSAEGGLRVLVPASTGELGQGDRILSGVPLFHSYGFDLGVLPTLYAGTTLVIEGSFVPRRTLRRIAYQVAAFLGVPAQYRAFLSARIDRPPDLSSARWLLSCTAPLAPETVTEFIGRFGVPICQHYGSSETGAATNHLPAEVPGRPASVGRAMSGVEIEVDDEGEVVVTSGAVARRYVLGAPPGESPLRNGVFRTGDLGTLDDDGFLTVLGRRDAMINVGGLKVSPAEVSATLERHPAVAEAAVLGFPDGRDEEVVYAVVSLSGAADESELIEFCRESLAEHKVPRRIEIRDALPRTATGKVKLGVDDLNA
jgi:acyl-CoA synthetase (AMP-forming)/AMP-acid ligase II